jgi:hypothetical protein
MVPLRRLLLLPLRVIQRSLQKLKILLLLQTLQQQNQ